MARPRAGRARARWQVWFRGGAYCLPPPGAALQGVAAREAPVREGIAKALAPSLGRLARACGKEEKKDTLEV